MKTAIFYFTGTGNSLKVARDLSAELKEAEIISIPKAIRQKDIYMPEVVGIVFPVYMFGLPLIVRDLIKTLDWSKSRYIFAILTYGGMAGGTMNQVGDLFKQKGRGLSSGFEIMMPGNYTPLYGAIPEDKQNRMFTKEGLRIKEMAKIIASGQEGDIGKRPGVASWLLSGIYALGAPRIPSMDKDFWADDKCNSCGICAKVCPVNNIEMLEDKPKWLSRCQQCLACLQWCPQESIQYKKSTIGRKRYRNPDISVDDIIGSK